VVWDGYPGAVTRVTLPLAFGFNVLLVSEKGVGSGPGSSWATCTCCPRRCSCPSMRA